MNQKKISRLCTKLMQGKISIEEFKQLNYWYDKEIQDDVLWEGDESEKDLKERLYNTISSKLAEDYPQKNRHFSRKKRFLQLSTVAAVLLISFGIFWKTDFNNQDTLRKEAIKSFDLPPGTSGAILVLDNGKKVELKKDDKTVLGEQDGAKIYNEVGAVSYVSQQATLPEESVVWNSLITPKGKEYRITLSDGSKVWLNSASKLYFPPVFNKFKREVILEGEAYFEIAKNPNLPFVVVSGETTVEVLGTHFNVKAYADETGVKTTLLEGSVKVDYSGEDIIIVPGEQALTQINKSIEVKNVDIEQVMAWQRGFFEFDNTPLSDIVKQISRWYDVEINYSSNKKEETFYGGRIDKSLNLKDIIKLLRQNGATINVEGDIINITP